MWTPTNCSTADVSPPKAGTARHHWSTDPTGDGIDDGLDDEFGLATIVRFFGTHLQR